MISFYICFIFCSHIGKLELAKKEPWFFSFYLISLWNTTSNCRSLEEKNAYKNKYFNSSNCNTFKVLIHTCFQSIIQPIKPCFDVASPSLSRKGKGHFSTKSFYFPPSGCFAGPPMVVGKILSNLLGALGQWTIKKFSYFNIYRQKYKSIIQSF